MTKCNCGICMSCAYGYTKEEAQVRCVICLEKSSELNDGHYCPSCQKDLNREHEDLFDFKFNEHGHFEFCTCPDCAPGHVHDVPVDKNCPCSTCQDAKTYM